MKKILTLVLALMMVLAGTAMAATENTMPICEPGDIKLTIFMTMETGSEQKMATYDEHPAIITWEEITGVDVTFIHPPTGDDGTYFNTLVASGEWPDIWIGSHFTSYYPGGVPQAIEDGILLNLNELCDEYATNYMALRNSWDAQTVANFTTDAGQYRFGAATQVPPVVDQQHSGWVIRKDLLEKYNLEVPTTIDELTNMLKVFKENGVEYPMASEALSNWVFESGSISGAYGVLSDSFMLNINEDGSKTVTYSALEPGYKDYIALLKSWMDAGYIDRDCINRTSTSDTQALFTSGKAGMVYAGNWTTQQLIALGQVENPDFAIVPMGNLSLDGDPNYVNQFADPIYNGQNTMWWCISSTSEHPVEALRALDYLYSYEGIELMVFGPDEWEGQQIHTTDPESGMRVFTDFMLNNPDGVPYNTIRYQYTIQNLSSEYCADMELQQYGAPINAECWDVWTSNCTNERHVPGAITMTAEESTTQINTMNNINTYLREKINLIVCGEDSIDNWDTYVEEIKNMGIADVCAAYQSACERYWAR